MLALQEQCFQGFLGKKLREAVGSTEEVGEFWTSSTHDMILMSQVLNSMEHAGMESKCQTCFLIKLDSDLYHRIALNRIIANNIAKTSII